MASLAIGGYLAVLPVVQLILGPGLGGRAAGFSGAATGAVLATLAGVVVPGANAPFVPLGPVLAFSFAAFLAAMAARHHETTASL